MIVHAVKVLEDNYAYICEKDGQCWVVDPGQAEPVRNWLKQSRLEVLGFLITHHHADHMAGLPDLYEHHHQIYGDQQLTFQHQTVGHDEIIPLFEGIQARCIHLPGHTKEALAFLIGGHLFTGDVLFGGGIGRIFEGSAENMYLSLSRLMILPDTTKVYFGHEYTKANLRFALEVEPGNQCLQERARQAQTVVVTTPSTLGLEQATNPFLRVESHEVKHSIEQQFGQKNLSSVELLAKLREWKSTFDAGDV